MDRVNEVEVLLVEDDPHEAELSLRALRMNKLGENVHHVTDGAQALEFLFATGPYAGRSAEGSLKLVLLDLHLPKVDGLEVLRKVKSDARTRRIPVVMLTSSRAERDLLESYTLGVNGYVVKPVGFDRFVESVSQLGRYWLRVNATPGAT